MNKRLFIVIEALLKNEEGLTREEINDILIQEGEEPLSRMGFISTSKSIYKYEFTM